MNGELQLDVNDIINSLVTQNAELVKKIAMLEATIKLKDRDIEYLKSEIEK